MVKKKAEEEVSSDYDEDIYVREALVTVAVCFGTNTHFSVC